GNRFHLSSVSLNTCGLFFPGRRFWLCCWQPSLSPPNATSVETSIALPTARTFVRFVRSRLPPSYPRRRALSSLTFSWGWIGSSCVPPPVLFSPLLLGRSLRVRPQPHRESLPESR